MSYRAEFCAGCPFARECSPTENQAVVARIPAYRGGPDAGVAVAWQDENGNQSHDVLLMATPADGTQFTDEEVAEAANQASAMVAMCKHTETENLLGRLGMPEITCGAFGSRYLVARFRTDLGEVVTYMQEPGKPLRKLGSEEEVFASVSDDEPVSRSPLANIAAIVRHVKALKRELGH